mmetsp:Transcript_44111/g.136306  ORF Transcript_44111/g.136306 Transcript_44111/m.136306 type:complete len:212 (+) Transcript_44111:679-1314(+)
MGHGPGLRGADARGPEAKLAAADGQVVAVGSTVEVVAPDQVPHLEAAGRHPGDHAAGEVPAEDALERWQRLPIDGVHGGGGHLHKRLALPGPGPRHRLDMDALQAPEAGAHGSLHHRGQLPLVGGALGPLAGLLLQQAHAAGWAAAASCALCGGQAGVVLPQGPHRRGPDEHGRQLAQGDEEERQHRAPRSRRGLDAARKGLPLQAQAAKT